MQESDIVALVFTLSVVLLAVLVAAVAVLFDYFPCTRKSLRHNLLVANQLMVKQQFVEAEKLLCKLAEKYPDQIAVPFLRTICFTHLGAKQNASSCVDEVACLIKHPKGKKSFIVSWYIKHVYGLEGLTYEDAVNKWVRQVRLDECARAHYQAGEYEQALQAVAEIEIQNTETQSIYRAWIAFFRMLMQDMQGAEADLILAEQLDPKGAQVVSIRGHWHLIHGEIEQAITCYKRHGNRNSIEEDMDHIVKVFGITPPKW